MTLANLNPTGKTTLPSGQASAVRQSVQRIDEFASQLKSMVQSVTLNSADSNTI